MTAAWQTLLLYGHGAVIGYLVGSIPTGYWLGRVIRGIDVRKFGSGNLGATNVFRVLGWKAGLFTLTVDILKGYLTVQLLMPTLSGQFVLTPLSRGQLWWYEIPYFVTSSLIVGFSVILGHTFSCFIGFRGGKGVATSTGVFAALMPLPTLAAVTAFAVVFAATRYVSLGSLLGVWTLTVASFMVSAPRPLAWASAAIALFVMWTHRSNIHRLLKRKENRIEWRKKSA